MRFRAVFYLLFFLLFSSCVYEEIVYPDISDTVLFGSAEDIALPRSFLSKQSDYVQIVESGIEEFKAKIIDLQRDYSDFQYATELDTMFTNPFSEEVEIEEFKSYFWSSLNTKDFIPRALQISSAADKQYFSYRKEWFADFVNVWLSKEDCWQNKDLSEGMIEGEYQAKKISYSWKRSGSILKMAIYSSGPFSRDNVKKDILLNLSDGYGKITILDFNRTQGSIPYKLEIRWENNGTASWKRFRDDVLVESGEF